MHQKEREETALPSLIHPVSHNNSLSIILSEEKNNSSILLGIAK
jgi:hypothetical protein